MPGTDVTAVLKTSRHRDATRTWTSNDMFDIDAPTVAVPYCDIVGTDNDQIHALRHRPSQPGRLGPCRTVCHR
jgi:hypothetical protein